MNTHENHIHLSDRTATRETISDQFQKANVKNIKSKNYLRKDKTGELSKWQSDESPLWSFSFRICEVNEDLKGKCTRMSSWLLHLLATTVTTVQPWSKSSSLTKPNCEAVLIVFPLFVYNTSKGTRGMAYSLVLSTTLVLLQVI